MKKENNYISFNFRIENSILKQLEQLAINQDRTIASLIRIAINQYLEKKQ